MIKLKTSSFYIQNTALLPPLPLIIPSKSFAIRQLSQTASYSLNGF